MVTKDPATGWEPFPATKCKFTFTNLESGKRYYVKYTLAGARNQKVSSTVASYVAQ